MRKSVKSILLVSFRITAVFLVFLVGIICILGSANTRSVRIQSKFEPLYKPNYTFQVTSKSDSVTDYTIGIINVEFSSKIKYATGEEIKSEEASEDFQKELYDAFEKILLSRGCKIMGPFASYVEMTFPERQRCTFLIRPRIEISATASFSPLTFLKDVGGPNLEAYAYASNWLTFKGKATMSYEILDPLTQEKLERHKFKTDEISYTAENIMQGYYVEGKPQNFVSLKQFAESGNPKLLSVYEKYYNLTNLDSKVGEAIFKQFTKKVDQLISVKEFDYLMQYKKELENKKRY